MQTAYREPKTRGLSAQMLYYGLQPLILVSALSYW